VASPRLSGWDCQVSTSPIRFPPLSKELSAVFLHPSVSLSYSSSCPAVLYLSHSADTYRLGTVVRDRFPDCPLTVIEIDTSPDDAHVPKNHLWPEPVPSIDGAVICYDAGDRSSFKPVEQLVRESCLFVG